MPYKVNLIKNAANNRFFYKIINYLHRNDIASICKENCSNVTFNHGFIHT